MKRDGTSGARRAWIHAGCLVALALMFSEAPVHAAGAQLTREAASALRANKPAEAVRLFTEALADTALANDQRAAILSDRGLAHARLKQFREAIDDFNSAIRLVPENAAVYNNRGGVLMELGMLGEAVRDFDRALLLAPGYAAALTNRAAAHAKRGNSRAAMADYSRAIGLVSGNPAALTGRALLHIASNRPHAAIRDLGRAISLDGRYGAAFNARAQARLSIERFPEAVEDLTRALSLEPTSADGHILRGFAYAASRNLVAAARDFARAVELAPNSPSALVARAFGHAKSEEYEQALDDLARAIELNPRFASAFAYRAWVYKLMDQTELGEKDIARAIALEPALPEALWVRGEMLEAAGQTAEATAELRRALELKPLLRDAAAALDRLGVGAAPSTAELPDAGVGLWTVHVRGNRYHAANRQFAKLVVPLEMMSDGQPRLIDWELREGALEGIGVLRFNAGTIEGANGAEDVEHGAVVDIRSRSVIAVELIRQGDAETKWAWTDTVLTVTGLDGFSEEYQLRQRVVAEEPTVRRPAVPTATRPRQGGGGTPSWAPWAQDAPYQAPPSSGRQRSGGGQPKPKTLFDLIFKGN